MSCDVQNEIKESRCCDYCRCRNNYSEYCPCAAVPEAVVKCEPRCKENYSAINRRSDFNPHFVEICHVHIVVLSVSATLNNKDKTEEGADCKTDNKK